MINLGDKKRQQKRDIIFNLGCYPEHGRYECLHSSWLVYLEHMPCDKDCKPMDIFGSSKKITTLRSVMVLCCMTLFLVFNATYSSVPE